MALVLSLLIFLQSTPATANFYTDKIFLAVVGLCVTFLSAYFGYLFARRKNNADADNSDSETIKNYIEIIAQQNRETDEYIKELRELARDVRGIESENADLKSAHKAQNEKTSEAASAIIRLLSNVENSTIDEPVFYAFRRDIIRAVEMLTMIKNRLKDSYAKKTD